MFGWTDTIGLGKAVVGLVEYLGAQLREGYGWPGVRSYGLMRNGNSDVARFLRN